MGGVQTRSLFKKPVAINIWLLALGYFVFYIPYSALIKALSSDLLVDYGVSNSEGTITAAAFLPVVLVGTIITMPLIILSLGWYRYLGFSLRNSDPSLQSSIKNNQIMGFNRWSLLSGIAFSVIIASTTMAYSFVGVSIVFALLLMRGGVLVMSPLVDQIFNREVHWYSWAGLTISLMAVGLALSQVGEYSISLVVLLNLACYLTGYIFRLRQMTHYAKDAQESLNRQFFVQENTVAMASLVFIGIGTLIFHLFSSDTSLSLYVVLMLSSGVFWVALLIGALYGVLGVFGSLIYLNRRENTFSIPVNRCASLLSGVCASLLLFLMFDNQNISNIQIISALSICVALLLMSVFDARQIFTHLHSLENPMQRVWLFVCDGNRMRSPMAAAICNKMLESSMGTLGKDQPFDDIVAESAAINLGSQRSMPDEAKAALSDLQIGVGDHTATQITEQQIHRAERIYCMSDRHCNLLAEQYPWAATKLVNLAGEYENNVSSEIQEIAEPAGKEKLHFLDLANILQQNIGRVVMQLERDFLANQEGIKGGQETLEQTNA